MQFFKINKNINKYSMNKINLDPKYELIIFDFDNTLCNINSYTSNITLYNINENNKTVIVNGIICHISELFNDYYDLLEIFIDLKNKDIKLIIASFGKLEIISKLITVAFGTLFDDIITSDNIDEKAQKSIPKISRHIIDMSCPKFYGKNIMIKVIMNKYNINEASKVIFFDDDYSNFYCSNNIKVYSVNNTKQGITSKLLIKSIYKLPKKYILIK